MNCIPGGYVCFSVSVWRVRVFPPPPLLNAVFGEEEAEEKGSSRLATAGFHPQ